MRIEITPELKILYPRAAFGRLIAKEVPNLKQHEALERRKRELENRIREVHASVDEDGVIKSYGAYFRRWGKTYPVELQVKTIRGGGRFPQVSALVDCMFMAEVKNRILTSGHDLDAVMDDLTFDVSDEGERYLKLGGKEQVLGKGDLILRDGEGILASVLYGPAKRTSIGQDASNALYFAWCPYGMDEGLIYEHLRDIFFNLSSVFGHVKSEPQIYR